MSGKRNQHGWDVVIIGAGIAGLTASIYLARAGLRVLVLDKGAYPGGRAISTELSETRVNLGGHALYKSALPILREVGVALTGGSPKPNPTFLFNGENGGKRALPLSHLLLGSFLKWREKTEFLRFYTRLRKTDTSKLYGVNLQSYLESQITSAKVRSVILSLVRLSTYCDAPDLLSAGVAIDQLKDGQVLYVDGGWQSIVDRLMEQAELAGVTIRAGAPAKAIDGTYPRMTVKLNDGALFESKYVLSTAGPKETQALIQTAGAVAGAAIYEKLVPVYAACLDLVVSGMPEPKTRFVLGADQPWYYSNHSAVASFSDNPSYEVVHVMKYLAVGDHSDPLQTKRELEGFLDCIQPGWRGHVVQERFLPRMLVTHAAVSAAHGGPAGRPGPEVPGHPGLYVAGDWVGPAGMLALASLSSAKAASRCIIMGNVQDKEGMTCGA